MFASFPTSTFLIHSQRRWSSARLPTQKSPRQERPERWHTFQRPGPPVRWEELTKTSCAFRICCGMWRAQRSPKRRIPNTRPRRCEKNQQCSRFRKTYIMGSPVFAEPCQAPKRQECLSLMPAWMRVMVQAQVGTLKIKIDQQSGE
jgi:hypothetical protein